VNFRHVHHLHFVGIGGVGMCGLAELLHAQGFAVSGCDLTAGETTERLASLGIPVAIGHAMAHLGDAQVVVISSAVAGTNPEVEAARAAGLPVIRRAEMLGEISRLKWGIAVAGTHGKTTTTSLLGHILTDAGWDPTVIVGGRVHLLGAHARLGRSEYLICEADEFDRSFLTLHPVVAVITNVEAEHLDTYGTVAAMEDAFLEFTGRVPFYGVTVVCGDDAGVRRILPRLTRQVVTYGLGEDSEIRATDLRANTAGTRATLVRSGEELGEVIVPMPGRHMLLDPMAATTAALEAGVRFSTIATAIASFSGVARRFERKGERADVVLVDDYAHHPTEVAATLAAARQSFPTRRVVAVFQPHLFSRTRTFATAFATALGVADVVVVLPIYPARETPLPGVTHRLVSDALIAAGHSAVEVCDSFDDALQRLETILRPNDLFLTLGAGNVVRLGERWLAGGRS